MKHSIKIQITLIFLLSIFLLIPYKSYINKKVYDPNADYQILKKINRSKIEMADNIMIVYDKNFKIDFYSNSIEQIYVKNLDKIIYLEIYKKYFDNYKGYFSHVFFNKDNKTFYFNIAEMSEISIDYYKNYIYSYVYYDDEYNIDKKKVKPFIPYFQTPKEFYENFKEYFFPYYLGEYEVKK